MDCSPPGSSVHGILQARVLKRVAMPSSREEGPRDQTRVSCIADSLPPGPSGKPLTILPQGTKWSKSYCYSRRPVKTLLQIQSLWQFPQIPGSARSPSLGSWNSLELITNGLLLFLFPFSCSHSDVYSVPGSRPRWSQGKWLPSEASRKHIFMIFRNHEYFWTFHIQDLI